MKPQKSMTTFRLGALEEQLKKEIEGAEKQDDKSEYSIVDDDEVTIIEGNPLEDSQYQKGYKIEGKETKSLYTSVASLNRSQKTLKEVEEREDKEGSMHDYRSKNNNLMARAGDIICPVEFNCSTKEVEEIKGLKFTKYNDEIENALDSTLEALKGMKEVDLKKLPLEVLENLILVLVNLGKESNEKLRSNNSLIAQMDCDLFGFVGTHEKLEAVNSYSQNLLEQLQKARAENIKLAAQLDSERREEWTDG